MKWIQLQKEVHTAGRNVVIRLQGKYGSKPIYTPRWASGFQGVIVRRNKNTITVDVLDGGKNIRIDPDDCGYYVLKENRECEI